MICQNYQLDSNFENRVVSLGLNLPTGYGITVCGFKLRYVEERKEEERREKRNKLKERKDDFKAMLESAALTSKSTYADFASKFGKDERFKAIDKARERESLFDEFMLDVRRREKEEKAAKREQVCWGVVSFLLSYRARLGFVSTAVL